MKMSKVFAQAESHGLNESHLVDNEVWLKFDSNEGMEQFIDWCVLQGLPIGFHTPWLKGCSTLMTW